MCGIAGFVFAADAPRPDSSALAAMTQALAHRGPDGAGHTMVGRVALVHTRLAIIDIAGGDQPIFAGPAALIANGEIYNDLALRAALPEVRFATGSDCEPPLHLWLRDGAASVARLRGMYAIAIHERGTSNLMLARDPFGIKPLYIAELEHGLAFASEPRALLEAGLVQRQGVRTQARDELLQLQFTTGRETIYPGISRVLPGETIRIAGGRVLDRTRIDALPQGRVESIAEPAALARLDAALEESVALHCRSDVPYGMFLSGGIDSASVLRMMQRVSDQPVRAFTAAFDVRGAADESTQAAVVAKACGARHEIMRIDEAMVWRHLPEIVASFDDPVADYAIIPTWLLARRASREMKVILSGEGGDEMFAGYGRYRRAMRPWWRGGRGMRRQGTFDGLGVLRRQPLHWRDGIAAIELRVPQRGSRLAAAQESDIAEWLPHDLLLKLDRCLMAHGVEGRTPLLDPAVAAAGFLLPDDLKVRGRMGKWLLRRWLETQLPEARPFAPKQGFTVPVGAWIAGAGDRLASLVARQPGIEEIAAPEAVMRLFRHATGRREQHAAWTLLFYALWHRTHVLGLAPEGDVFETLAA
ncbi:asparagine synthase (glutamine-hydrolyzing) [Lichenicoccus roseus]|uniref:asparagine synthase (glutamine-hydrolyzing) n=1 Tax=Lichenicoccus roseus TaxID=2683649 RepID=A0A5R9JDW5_9PROT|nr:asparagine synthase (glutamine-hydrolyzing) [Lichenicoccus roseus]TLU72488.1 asparagine synthase (glutamine-hydrolyzing) [Lichenicoccus roseus]